MSREDFIAVAARLFAVYAAFHIALDSARYTPLVIAEGWTPVAVGYVALWVLALVACAYLWVFPLTLARKLLPVMKEPRSEQAVDASVALSLGLTLIGVWILAYAVVNSVYWLMLIVRVQQMGAQFHQWTPEQFAGMAATVVELGAGIWLLFGNAGIKRLIYKFRYGRIEVAEPERPVSTQEEIR